MDVAKQVAYWKKGAREDLDTARILSANRKGREALFFMHLAIEKGLRPLAVKATGQFAPFSQTCRCWPVAPNRIPEAS